MDGLMRRRGMTASAGGSSGGGGSGDPWAAVFAAEANGTYSTLYSVGDTVELDLGTEGVVHMQIIAFDTDDLADGSGKAPITWISQELLATTHRMNPTLAGSTSWRTSGTGSVGGWEKCEMRTYLKETVKPLIPAAVRDRIVEVTKYSRGFTQNNNLNRDGVTADDVWIPSMQELSGTSAGSESLGPQYSFFSGNTPRAKTQINGTSPTHWWARTADSQSAFKQIQGVGNIVFAYAQNASGVALGFCT